MTKVLGYTQSKSLMDYRLSNPSNLVHFASKLELYWVAVALLMLMSKLSQ